MVVVEVLVEEMVMVVAGMVKEEVVLVVMITVMMILFPWPCGKHFPYIITLNVSF